MIMGGRQSMGSPSSGGSTGAALRSGDEGWLRIQYEVDDTSSLPAQVGVTSACCWKNVSG
jgi:hypothetical protein